MWSFPVILILFLGWRFRLRIAFAAAMAFSVLAAFSVEGKEGLSWLFWTLFLYNTAPLIAFKFRRVIHSYKQDFKKGFGEVESEYAALLSSKQEVILTNKELNSRFSELAGLYDIINEISEALRFEEIFDKFGSFLKKRFNFSRVKFLVLEKGKTESFFEIIGETSLLVQGIDDEKRLIEETLIKRKVVESKDSLAFPLLFSEGAASEREIIGMIIVEGIEKKDVEFFLIAAGEFEMGMKKVKLYETVQKLAITDSVTNVYVRRYFMERFDDEIERSIRRDNNLSILMMDIDHFKQVNDTYGHLVGDFVLSEIGKIIHASIREIDLLGRYGGEEFCLFLPETHKEGACQVAERIRAEIEKYLFKAYDETLRVTISCGVAVLPEDGAFLEELIEKADVALYRAKDEGRNRVVHC